jgi:hypothetical protein
MKRVQVLLLKVRGALRRLVHRSPAKTLTHSQSGLAHGHASDEAMKGKRNISRFFVNQRQITWVMLIGVCVWGVYSYKSMPQRKDPDTPVKTAVAICPWPGVNAEKIEQLVTRKIEEKIAQNANVEKIRSISRTNVSVVYVDLDENFPGSQIAKEFDDIALKLDSIKDLPDGAGPVQFIKDFGDTATLMLTVASPRISAVEIELRHERGGDRTNGAEAKLPSQRDELRWGVNQGLFQDWAVEAYTLRHSPRETTFAGSISASTGRDTKASCIGARFLKPRLGPVLHLCRLQRRTTWGRGSNSASIPIRCARSSGKAWSCWTMRRARSWHRRPVDGGIPSRPAPAFRPLADRTPAESGPRGSADLR